MFKIYWFSVIILIIFLSACTYEGSQSGSDKADEVRSAKYDSIQKAELDSLNSMKQNDTSGVASDTAGMTE